ncbi:hypothetical protein MRX96_028332 [Rhipicephalus microplus]
MSQHHSMTMAMWKQGVHHAQTLAKGMLSMVSRMYLAICTQPNQDRMRRKRMSHRMKAMEKWPLPEEVLVGKAGETKKHTSLPVMTLPALQVGTELSEVVQLVASGELSRADLVCWEGIARGLVLDKFSMAVASAWLGVCIFSKETSPGNQVSARGPKSSVSSRTSFGKYSDHEFRRHFRLARPVAEKLVAEFAVSSMCPSSTHGGVQAKSSETHVLTFIWYAANKTCMRDVASRFDMSESTVYRVLQKVAQFLDDAGTIVVRSHQHELAGLRGTTCAWHAKRHVPSPARTEAVVARSHFNLPFR